MKCHSVIQTCFIMVVIIFRIVALYSSISSLTSSVYVCVETVAIVGWCYCCCCVNKSIFCIKTVKHVHSSANRCDAFVVSHSHTGIREKNTQKSKLFRIIQRKWLQRTVSNRIVYLYTSLMSAELNSHFREKRQLQFGVLW